jgi:hypothetical protein
MDREKAQREAERRNREHPDSATHGWVAHARADGAWSLVRVPKLPGANIDPLKATTEAKPKPSLPDDPRSSYVQNIGGPWAG